MRRAAERAGNAKRRRAANRARPLLVLLLQVHRCVEGGYTVGLPVAPLRAAKCSLGAHGDRRRRRSSYWLLLRHHRLHVVTVLVLGRGISVGRLAILLMVLMMLMVRLAVVVHAVVHLVLVSRRVDALWSLLCAVAHHWHFLAILVVLGGVIVVVEVGVRVGVALVGLSRLGVLVIWVILVSLVIGLVVLLRVLRLLLWMLLWMLMIRLIGVCTHLIVMLIVAVCHCVRILMLLLIARALVIVHHFRGVRVLLVSFCFLLLNLIGDLVDFICLAFAFAFFFAQINSRL